LLAIDPSVPGFLLPADQVHVSPDPLDADFAVQVGLSKRADLNLLRQLIGQTDPGSVPAVRRVMVGLTPLLGAVMPPHELPPLLPYVSGVAKAEACHVRNVLQKVLKDREREATKEIRTAIAEWDSARDLVAMGRKTFDLSQTQVKDLEKRVKLGQGVEIEAKRAKLELLKQEAALIGEIIKWKLADVRAREVLGLLCGE